MNCELKVNVNVNEMILSEGFLCATAACGKFSACVEIGEEHVRVIVNNSSHKAFKKCGRAFSTVTEALEYYKTPEIKAIISEIDRRNS